MLLDPLLQVNFLCKFLVIGCATLSLRDSAVKYLNICEDQLIVDCLDIADRINRTIDMNDIRIFKAAYNVHDRICLTNVG